MDDYQISTPLQRMRKHWRDLDKARPFWVDTILSLMLVIGFGLVITGHAWLAFVFLALPTIEAARLAFSAVRAEIRRDLERLWIL
jgi:hypothetical protein